MKHGQQARDQDETNYPESGEQYVRQTGFHHDFGCLDCGGIGHSAEGGGGDCDQPPQEKPFPMTAKHKLNSASVLGVLLLSGLIGWLTGSPLLFIVLAMVFIGLAIQSGDIRFERTAPKGGKKPTSRPDDGRGEAACRVIGC
jgi:hypothetical protein